MLPRRRLRHDIGGLIALALVALAFVPLAWHILHGTAQAQGGLALDAPLPTHVPPGTTLVVGDPIVEKIIKHNGWDKTLPFRIQWAQLSGGPQVNQAFQAKALDVGSAADIPPIHATWIGIPTKIVAYRLRQDPIAFPTYVIGTAPGSDITKLADLKGKRIATSKGQAQGAVVYRTLQQAHLRPEDVTLVELPASPTIYSEALAAHQVDAAPIAAGLQAQRYLSEYGPDGARLLSHGPFRDDPGLLYARTEVLRDPAKAAALRLYVQLWARAWRWADAHRQEWVHFYYVQDQGVTPAEGDIVARAVGQLDLPLNWDKAIALQQQTVDMLAAETGRASFPAATLFDRRFEQAQRDAPNG
jgi:sulfonate transport system substrate-binding protein